MDVLERDLPTVLRAMHDGPCVSLYQPTHRSHPENQQDPIRFRNLVDEVEQSLAQKYADRESAAMLRPFHELAENGAFWNKTLDGLAVFATPDLFKVYRLQRSVSELAVVAESFHTKPLLRITQSADRYQVLGLNRQEVTLFEGDRYALDAVELAPGFPRTVADVVEPAQGEPERTKRAHGPAGPGRTTRHGTDVRQDAIDHDTERFFRAVDKAVFERYSQPSGLPLVLAALPEHHHLFKTVSRNPLLVSGTIDAYPTTLPIDDLRERAWKLMLPTYLERLSGLVDRFGASRAEERGGADVAEIGRAAAANRVATLLIEADRVVPGRFDAQTGAIEFARLDDPGVDDLLDDLGEHTLRAGGEVVIVPAERMPTETGLAAIYRF